MVGVAPLDDVDTLLKALRRFDPRDPSVDLRDGRNPIEFTRWALASFPASDPRAALVGRLKPHRAPPGDRLGAGFLAGFPLELWAHLARRIRRPEAHFDGAAPGAWAAGESAALGVRYHLRPPRGVEGWRGVPYGRDLLHAWGLLAVGWPGAHHRAVWVAQGEEWAVDPAVWAVVDDIADARERDLVADHLPLGPQYLLACVIEALVKVAAHQERLSGRDRAVFWGLLALPVLALTRRAGEPPAGGHERPLQALPFFCHHPFDQALLLALHRLADRWRSLSDEALVAFVGDLPGGPVEDAAAARGRLLAALREIIALRAGLGGVDDVGFGAYNLKAFFAALAKPGLGWEGFWEAAEAFFGVYIQRYNFKAAKNKFGAALRDQGAHEALGADAPGTPSAAWMMVVQRVWLNLQRRFLAAGW